MVVARGRGAGDDRAALAGDVHGGAEGLAARVLEDDVDVLAAGEFADALAEALPLLRVLGVLVLPELVALGVAVDDRLGTHRPADVRLLLAGDHADRVGPARERELRGVRAESAARAPDQDVVALLHAGAVAGDQLPVGGGVDQAGGGGLLPAEVVRLGHQLVGLDQRDLGEAAEVGLEAPDALLGVEHRVVVAVGGLQLDRQTVRDDLVTGLPGVDARAGAQDDAREVGADDVVRQVVTLGLRRQLSVPFQEAEGRQRFEDRGPDGVVVDRGGHHGHQGLTRPHLRHRNVVEMQRLARILVRGRRSLEEVGLFLSDNHAPVALGDAQTGEVFGGRFAGQYGAHYGFHVTTSICGASLGGAALSIEAGDESRLGSLRTVKGRPARRNPYIAASCP